MTCVIGLVITVAAVSAQPGDTVVGFDGGDNGGFTGNAFFESSGGNPDGNAHFLLETFGIELRSGAPGENSNPAFLGDYSGSGLVTIGLDVRVDDLNFFGTPTGRNLGLVFVDHDNVGPSGPAGVWYDLGVISEATTSDWTRFELSFDDFDSETLPEGWVGFGDEDPNTFEPILPEGVTFASIFEDVDEFRITTFEPGFFFGFTNFDARFDNISIETTAVIPEPSAAVVFATLSLGGFVRRRR
jgi:hypothetical protein